MKDFIVSIEECVNYLGKELPFVPDICLMLGTGLGRLSEKADIEWKSPYSEIPNFPVSTAPEHAGNLLIGRIGQNKIAIFEGRFHFYEGYSARELTLPVRVMGLLGAKCLIGCNAAGGLNLSYSSGDLMLIKDHINLIPDNPLRGPNVDQWGPRFPDMSKAYSERLGVKMKEAAKNISLDLKEGVFVAVPGPSLETPAETRMLKNMGADAVAMSLVPEVIVAVHAGMDVAGISVIANVNDPDNFQPILIEDVVEQAQKAEKNLAALLIEVMKEPLCE